MAEQHEIAGHWHNQLTGEWDYRTTPTTDDEMVQYIPQSEVAQMLYKCHRQMGKPVLEAAGRVLAAVVGEEWSES